MVGMQPRQLKMQCTYVHRINACHARWRSPQRPRPAILVRNLFWLDQWAIQFWTALLFNTEAGFPFYRYSTLWGSYRCSFVDKRGPRDPSGSLELLINPKVAVRPVIFLGSSYAHSDENCTNCCPSGCQNSTKSPVYVQVRCVKCFSFQKRARSATDPLDGTGPGNLELQEEPIRRFSLLPITANRIREHGWGNNMNNSCFVATPAAQSYLSLYLWLLVQPANGLNKRSQYLVVRKKSSS
ncbi:hypothetical protein QBC35DRAFT_275511 [Podospora australis]|uniref:Uncharacterized protein n=1 Tax=Podospora australis TaxID=1536484 RepID=A0AAN6X5G9_9PEZI|nr:hypothetical protein QBC35DRAFT_275511 [Podospora australis]